MAIASKTVRLPLVVYLIAGATGLSGQPLHAEDARPVASTGSALSKDEAESLLRFHNRARKEVGVPDVRWSPALATFAQQWANEVAKTGTIAHRPQESGEQLRYGENMAWGMGDAYGVLAGAELWYNEIKLYPPDSSIPDDLRDFKAAHYTQMVWKNTTEIGAGKAIVQTGDKKGWTVIVCNYNPPGNIAGQKPFAPGPPK